MYDPYDSNRFYNALRRQRLWDAFKCVLALLIIAAAIWLDGTLFPTN